MYMYIRSSVFLCTKKTEREPGRPLIVVLDTNKYIASHHNHDQLIYNYKRTGTTTTTYIEYTDVGRT